MIDDEISFRNVFRGLKGDFGSLGIVIGIVFLLLIPMGTIYILIFIFKEALVYVGVVGSALLVPFMMTLGLFLNLYLFKRIPKRDEGFWTFFRMKEIPVEVYTKKYRALHLIRRFSFLGIMVVFFVFVLIVTGIVNIFPGLCCLFAPVSIPLIVLTITIPPMAWIAFTYALDPYQPEARGMIILGVTWGLISTFPSLFLNTFNSFWMEDAGLSTAVVSAPIFEEFFKSLGFVLIFSQIKDETDGIIYGATFGAGFSLMENLLYGGTTVFEGGGIAFVILVGFRSFFNIVGHMLGPALIGFFIGWNKGFLAPKMKNKFKDSKFIYVIIIFFSLLFLIIFGYILSVINHGMWNYLAGFGLSWVFVLMFAFGIFQLVFFVLLTVFAYFLATGRYNRKLRAYQNKRKERPKIIKAPPGMDEKMVLEFD